MDLGLKNKPVLVMASSAGIGKGIATIFAEEGANVMLFSISEEKLKKAQQEIFLATGKKPAFSVGDMSNYSDIKRTVSLSIANFGSIYALVNNSGGPPAGTFENFNDQNWQSAFELTLLSYLRTIREVIPVMKENGQGRILNITSTSIKQALDNMILSNTFRMGIVGLSKSLASEFGKYNILVNVLGPGRTDTERLQHIDSIWAEEAGMSVNDFKRDVFKKIPLGRYGDPSELGKLAVFLCSEANTYITGQMILVDGGIVRAY